jgi:hypothetical protein
MYAKGADVERRPSSLWSPCGRSSVRRVRSCPSGARPDHAPRAVKHYAGGMCRNIRTLHNFEPPATHEEIHASALQYVRKISGFTKPSKANEAAFEAAVEAVAAASETLLAELTTSAPPKNRDAEAAKARARAAQRYAA